MIFTFDTAGTLGSTAVLTQGASGLDFANAGTGTCKAGTAYTAGETCTVNVSFTPKFAGTRYGAAELLDGSGNVIATGYVQGTGVGSQVAFLPGTQSVVVSGGSFIEPEGVAVDGAGNLYFANECSGCAVSKETFSAEGSTQSTIANFSSPQGVAVDGSGNIYVAAGGGVFKEAYSGGAYSQSTVASLENATGVAVDGSGNVYIADWANTQVLKENLSGGNYTQSVVTSSATGTLSSPAGIAVDGNGNVYIADYYQRKILKETPSAGGYTESIVYSSYFNLSTVAVDGNGNVYLSEGSNIIKETPTGDSYVQSTIYYDRTIGIHGMTVDGAGNFYLGLGTYKQLLKLDFSDPPSLTFLATAVGSTSTDSPQTVTVENIGNAPLSFSVPTTGDNPSISPNFALNSSEAGACPLLTSSSSSLATLAAGGSCLLPISFDPTTVGLLSGSLILTDNSLNVSDAAQSIALRGTGISPLAQLTSPVPGSMLTGSSVTFAWSAGIGLQNTSSG